MSIVVFSPLYQARSPLPAPIPLSVSTDVLYRRNTNGEFVPIEPLSNQMQYDHSTRVVAVDSRRIVDPRSIGPDHEKTHSAPAPVELRPAKPPSTKFVAPHPPEKADAAVWDGWPDGYFEQDFSFDEWEALGELKVHWSYKVCGGHRKGDDEADEWEEGKRSEQQCKGVLICENEECQVITRAQTTSSGIAKQLRHPCRCGADLNHCKCSVRSRLFHWAGGVHYINGGIHEHPRPSHILHLLPKEKAQFIEIVAANPKLGPLGLIVGIPGIRGPGKSVANISNILLNADQVSKEKQKYNVDRSSGIGFVNAFEQFCQEHPGFVIYGQLEEVTVISLQSPFMAAQLLPDEGKIPCSVNGLVSDAAHGFWVSATTLLMVSSTFSLTLQ